MKQTGGYTTDPKEVYTLELNRLQRCFSDIAAVGEGISELKPVGWRQVWYLRQLIFLLLQAQQIGEQLLRMD